MVGVVLEVEVCEVGGARAVDVQLREWAADLLVGQELGLGSSPIDVTGQLLRRNTSDLNQKGSPITIKRGISRNEKLPPHLWRIKRLYSPPLAILFGSQFWNVNAQKVRK